MRRAGSCVWGLLCVCVWAGVLTGSAAFPPLNFHSLKHGIASHQLSVQCINPPTFTPAPTKCHSNVCMSIWTEHFPLQWMRTSKYNYEDDPRNIIFNVTLRAPSYSPFDNIQCDVVTNSNKLRSQSVATRIKHLFHHYTKAKATKANIKNKNVLCSCTIPADTSDRMYTTATNHHVVAFGDSTMRNFYSFYHDIISDAATMLPVSLLYPNTFTRKNIDVNQIPMNHYRTIANLTMRGGPIAAFVEDMGNNCTSHGYFTDGKKYTISHPAICPIGSGNRNSDTDTNHFSSTSMSSFRNGSSISSTSSRSSGSNGSNKGREKEVPYVKWVPQSYDDLGDPSIQYEENARYACVHSDPKNVIVFALSAGLHYIPRHKIASAYRFLRYEYDIARAFQQLIRGVLSVQGCFERTVFLWKSPNVIDFHARDVMAAKFDFPSIDSCVQQSKAEFLKFQNYTASFADVRTMQDVCARFRFDTNASDVLHQRSSGVIRDLNSCIFGHLSPNGSAPHPHSHPHHLPGLHQRDRSDGPLPDLPTPATAFHAWRNWSTLPWSQESSVRRFVDENLVSAGESFLCPADLKHSILVEHLHDPSPHNNSPSDSTVLSRSVSRDKNNFHQRATFAVGGILVFPGSILTKYFAASGLKTDWKHYGFPLYSVFLRAIQGTVQEYMAQKGFLFYAPSHHRNLIETCLLPLCFPSKPSTEPASVRRLRASVCPAYEYYRTHNFSVSGYGMFYLRENVILS